MDEKWKQAANEALKRHYMRAKVVVNGEVWPITELVKAVRGGAYFKHRWNSVHDVLPPDGEVVIAYNANKRTVCFAFTIGMVWCDEDSRRLPEEPDYWMPLPELPEEEEE